MKPDIPLLRKYVEWVEEQAARPVAERDWFQGSWVSPRAACGTAYCVAGRVVTDAGYHFVIHHPVRLPFDEITEVRFGDDPIEQVDHVAQRILGISDEQAYELFLGSNSAQRIREIAEKIAGERL
jgi:hypothetical protein